MKRNKFLISAFIALFACFSGVVGVSALEISTDELRSLLGNSVVITNDTEEMLGGTTNYDDLVVDDYVYFNKGSGSYGIRDNSGTLQYKNSGGSWASLGSTAIAGGGWVADATNYYMYATVNANGDPYPITIGKTSTTTSNVDGATDLIVAGGTTMEGELYVAGATKFNGGSLVFNEDSTNSLTARFESDGDANNLMLYGAGDAVGIGVADPDTKLEVYKAGTQLKLSYGSSDYSTLAVGSGGDLTITPSGGDATIAGTLTISGTLSVGTTTMTAGDLLIDTTGLVYDSSAGNLGIGVADPDYALEILDTSAPLKLSYDDTNYATFVISSSGDLTVAAYGGDISFSDENLLTTGTLTADNTVINGSFTANEASENVDFRVEGNGDANLIFGDGSADAVGIGTSTPVNKLVVVDGTNAQLQLSYNSTNSTTFTTGSGGDITIVPSGGDTINTGTLTVSSAFVGNEGGANVDSRIESNDDANAFYVDASLNLIGIGTSTPDAELAIFGSEGYPSLTIASSSGAYLAYLSNIGNLGLGGVVDPDYQLEILDTTAPLKLSYNGSNAATFVVSSGGDLTIAASGGDISFGDENILTTGTLGAGATVVDRFTYGPTTLASSTIDTAATMNVAHLISYSGYDFTVNFAANTFTIPATSTMTAFIPSAGDCADFRIRNVSSTSASSTTIAAGVGIDLVENENGDVVIEGGNEAQLKFCRELDTDVTVYVDEYVAAD